MFYHHYVGKGASTSNSVAKIWCTETCAFEQINKLTNTLKLSLLSEVLEGTSSYCDNYLETSRKFWQRNLTLFTHLDRAIPREKHCVEFLVYLLHLRRKVVSRIHWVGLPDKMKFQSPGSGRWLFYQLAKLYGGHSNWYCGKRWAFRTRWRLFSYGKAIHSFGRNRFNTCSKRPIIGGGNRVSLVF